jgi:hypothetical protein
MTRRVTTEFSQQDKEKQSCAAAELFPAELLLFQSCISQYGNKKKPSPEEDTE